MRPRCSPQIQSLSSWTTCSRWWEPCASGQYQHLIAGTEEISFCSGTPAARGSPSSRRASSLSFAGLPPVAVRHGSNGGRRGCRKNGGRRRLREVQTHQPKGTLRLSTALLDDMDENAERFNLRHNVARLRSPLLLIHGNLDLTVPVAAALKLYDSSNPMTTRLHILQPHRAHLRRAASVQRSFAL